MAADDTGTSGTEPEGANQDDATGSKSGSGFGDLPVAEQLMGVGALLTLFVSDLLGDIFLDEYSIGQVTWIVALTVVIAIYAHRFGGVQMPISYGWTIKVLGYAGAIMGAREFIDDIDGSVLEGSTVLFALALYAGAVLMAVGAYRVSRSD